MRTVRFELLRPQEIVQERARCPVVYIPLGPLEWHSLHMPFGTDALNATALALQTAERVGGVVLPTFFWGTERERSPQQAQALGFDADEWLIGMDFPNHLLKSLYCREEFLALLLRELLTMVLDLRYKIIVLVNGHGATNQIATLERLTAEFNACSSARVLLVTAAPPGADRASLGHADALETSLMMAAHPDCVAIEDLPPVPQPLHYCDWGIVDSEAFDGHPTPDFTLRSEVDPRLQASADKGQRAYQQMVAALEEMVRLAVRSLGEE